MNIPKEVTEAKAKSTILELTSEDGKMFYFRKPEMKDMNRYLALAAKRKLAAASQNLIYDLSVKPSREELKKLISDNPGLMVALSNALQEAVGLNEEFEVKKL